MKPSRRLPWFLPLTLALLTSTSAARADDIDKLYEQGEAAFDAGKFEEARSKFALVWALRKSYDVAAVLAQAELKAGRNAEAAEHLAYAVAHFPVSASTEVRKKIEAAFAEVRVTVAAIRVELSPATATLTVNGRVIAESERQDLIFVDPGQVRVEASAPGYLSSKRTVDVAKGGEAKATIAMEADVAPRSKVPAFVLGGVGVAGVVVGGVLLGVGLSERSNVEAAMPRDANGKPSCVRSADAGPELHPDCPKLRSRIASAQTMANVGLPVLLVGGAAVAGAAAYFFWPAAEPRASKPGSTVLPVASADGAGLVWVGSF